MDIRDYLDSTYLKTAVQAGLSVEANLQIALQLVQEAIDNRFKLAMIRPEVVAKARQLVDQNQSQVLIGTVIDFPLGQAGLEAKLTEASQAIKDGADELDFVCDYEAFKSGHVEKVEREVLACSRLGLDNGKVVKWIIEIAALTPDQIEGLSALIRNIVETNFSISQANKVFIKSSTGFYATPDGSPNGATVAGIRIMKSQAGTLPIKAAGGVRNYREAMEMIELGVSRIGTSAALAIVQGRDHNDSY